MENETKILYELIIDVQGVGNKTFYSFSKATLYQISFRLIPDLKWGQDEYGNRIGYATKEENYERAWLNECKFVENIIDVTDEFIKEITEN